MDVKCLLVTGNEARLGMRDLMDLVHGDRWKETFSQLGTNHLVPSVDLRTGRGALFLTGGRGSIQRFLIAQNAMPRYDLIGTYPFQASVMRKHRTFSKNETCVKIVEGPGHNNPPDGSPLVDMGYFVKGVVKGGPPALRLAPIELLFALKSLYGWESNG